MKKTIVTLSIVAFMASVALAQNPCPPKGGG